MTKIPVALTPEEELEPLPWWQARSTWLMAFGVLAALIRLANAFGWAPLGLTEFDAEGATSAVMELLAPVLLFLAYRERLNPRRKIAFRRGPS
ncbi:MAG: hypothetical protein DI556_09905 [Rhodovulum sulfidophilum]|uniref:Uncharacterized protein n=1 Tax=Rhodovulum sulfidophilum TaxID=35806 RepID=A0A2W5NG79_RHOSU|nr:MAG: hypothetical protein DI556_09905 [Rhodovulum sulfidophilum]